MARIRSIKPDFFKNEDLAKLPYQCRLFFIGVWTLCDRRGFVEYRPEKIRAEIFPYSRVNVDLLIQQLSNGFLKMIDIEGKKYLHVNNFCKHQVINVKENESTVPAQYWNSADTVPAQYENYRKGREGKGIGREGKEASPPTLKTIQSFFTQNGYDCAEKFFNTYSKNNWYDTKGNLIEDWQQKAKDVWFKPENKIQVSDISKINADSERLD